MTDNLEDNYFYPQSTDIDIENQDVKIIFCPRSLSLLQANLHFDTMDGKL